MGEVISHQDHDMLVRGGGVGSGVNLVDHLHSSEVTVEVSQSWVVLNWTIFVEMFVNLEPFWIGVLRSSGENSSKNLLLSTKMLREWSPEEVRASIFESVVNISLSSSGKE
jgi:hypothetical protein